MTEVLQKLFPCKIKFMIIKICFYNLKSSRHFLVSIKVFSQTPCPDLVYAVKSSYIFRYFTIHVAIFYNWKIKAYELEKGTLTSF